jgi:hypothetical protein
MQYLQRPCFWIVNVAIIVLLGLVAQFYMFRLPAVYDLCFKTHLYDHVWWVNRPAKHLILGSSNAMNGIIPKQIEALRNWSEGSVLNLGLNGASPVVMLRNLNLYLQRFPFPERIDLVLTPSMLEERYHVKQDYEKVYLTLLQWKVLKEEVGAVNSYFFPSMLFWQACHFDKMEIFRQYHFDLKSTRESQGFQPNYEHPYVYQFSPQQLPKLDSIFGWSKPQMSCLRQIQELAIQHNSTLRYLVTPVHPMLYEHYKAQPQLLLGLELLLKTTLGEIKIEGSLNPHVFGLEHQHFINGDHLTLKGAKSYTEKMYGPQSTQFTFGHFLN